ncbi:LysR family transcriptional regulator [Paraburkholderia xenovorans]
MNLSLRHLRAFTTLAAVRSFTRAAEQCHLSQPAFSALIQNLEDHAGVRLFNRSTRNVELTTEGALFEAAAARLLNDMTHAFDELNDHTNRRRGRVTIAALPTVAAGALPPVLTEFRERHPGIEIVLKDVTADTCLEVLRNKQVDLALSAPISPGRDLVSEPLLSDTFHFVCRSDHPLAKHKELVARDVLDQPVIKFARTSSIRQHLDAAFYPSGPPTELEVNQLVTAAGLISSGIGATLVPTLALFQFQMPGLVAVPIRLPISDRQICLIRRRNDAGSTAVTAFVEVLRKRWADLAHARTARRRTTASVLSDTPARQRRSRTG